MAYAPSQKLVDYAIIAALIGGAYVIYSKFFATAPPKTCPAGQHYVDVCADAGTGLGQWLCNAGRNLLGGSGLDCKPDEIVCPEGYTLQNGQCTAILPGGCTITDADCKTADPRTYLNLTDCTCKTSNYTDECTLGVTDCKLVPEQGPVGIIYKKKVQKCVFAPPFGNRWQSTDVPCGGDTDECTLGVTDCKLVPEQGPTGIIYKKKVQECVFAPPFGNRWQSTDVPCGGDTPILPLIPPVSCGVSECTPGVSACFDGLSHVCMEQGTGCEDRGIWAHGGHACDPVTNIVDCGNGCGLVDLNNPPGTTCEQVCKPLWTPGCVQDVAECRRLNENTPGGLFSGFMSRSQCEGAGYIFVNDPPNYCANQARLDYDKRRAKACCW